MQSENMSHNINAEIDTNIIFKQYELLVKEAARISQARGVCNGFYSTLFFAVFAVLFKSSVNGFYTIILSFIMMIISAVWLVNIDEYKKLNSAKFQVINSIEKNFFEIKPFIQEWDILQNLNKNVKGLNKYFTLSNVEKMIPIFCGIACFIVLMKALIFP